MGCTLQMSARVGKIPRFSCLAINDLLELVVLRAPALLFEGLSFFRLDLEPQCCRVRTISLVMALAAAMLAEHVASSDIGGPTRFGAASRTGCLVMAVLASSKMSS